MAFVLASAPPMPWAGPGPAEGLSKYLLSGEPRSASHSLSMPRLALVHTIANASLCVSFSISSLPAPWGLGFSPCSAGPRISGPASQVFC